MPLVVGASEFDYNHLLSDYYHLSFGGKDGGSVDVRARCEFLPRPRRTAGQVCELFLWYALDYMEGKKNVLRNVKNLEILTVYWLFSSSLITLVQYNIT